MAVWPSSLPQIAIGDEFEESADSNVIRSEVDVGPAKLRQRYTAEIKRYRFPLILTTTQVGTLETFFTATIGYGTLPFDWLNQRTRATVSLLLVNRPAYRELAGDLWRTSLDLELRP